MHSSDRYILALAILDGDREARKVLADLLEEQGDRGLAQWAREGRNSKQRRLDFAIMLLPCRVAIGMVTEFVQHAFANRPATRLRNRLAGTIDQWRSGSINDDDMFRHCEGCLADLRPVPRSGGIHYIEVKAAVEIFIEAVRCAIRAAEAQRGEASGSTPRNWETMAGQNLRAVLAITQKPLLPARVYGRSTDAAEEIEWQIERTKALLQQLLTAQDSHG